MLIAHLTDTHIRAPGVIAMGRVDTNAMLRTAITDLMRRDPAPDVVIVTGDLIDQGTPDEYAALRDLLSPLRQPVFLIPGNHDHRENLRAAFPDHGYLPDGPFLQYAIDEYPLRLIALDSHVPGASHGELCPERLSWLERTLAATPDKPTILFLHHPPFPTGLDGMDAIACRDGDALGRIVERHPNIERVLCGHVHRSIQVRWRGTLGCVAPGTAHQVALDLQPERPAMYNLEPPCYMLHLWRETTGVISHTAFTGLYDGPYDFSPSDRPADDRKTAAT